MQGTWVRSLIRGDPTCHEATKPTDCNCRVHTRGLTCRSHRAMCLEPMRHKRPLCKEKPERRSWRAPGLTTRESPHTALKAQCAIKLKINPKNSSLFTSQFKYHFFRNCLVHQHDFDDHYNHQNWLFFCYMISQNSSNLTL